MMSQTNKQNKITKQNENKNTHGQRRIQLETIVEDAHDPMTSDWDSQEEVDFLENQIKEVVDVRPLKEQEHVLTSDNLCLVCCEKHTEDQMCVANFTRLDRKLERKWERIVALVNDFTRTQADPQMSNSSLLNPQIPYPLPSPDIMAPEQPEQEPTPQSLTERIRNLVCYYFGRGAHSARTIGISVKRRLVQFIRTIISVIRPALGDIYHRVNEILSDVLISMVDRVWNFVARNFESARKMICSLAAIALAGIAICMPSHMLSMSGRFLFGAMALLVAYTQSYVAVGVSAGLAYLLQRMTSKYTINVSTQVTNNIPRASPQNLKEDTKSLVLDMVALSVIVSAGTTGLALPTDAKSWDDMLKRHSQLHRAYSAWSFGAEKISEIFDRTAHYIFKHLLGKEYTSASYISEIENLYTDVMTLCRLDVNIQIGRDPQLAVKIEQMYLRYLALCRVYAGNRLVMNKLTKLGGPLTDYYRRVTDKNPKSHVMRKEPVCISLSGATGIGKSYLMNRFQQDALKICGKFDPSRPMEGLIYARAIEQEFWDGYIGQPVAIYDDFGQKVDSQSNPNLEFFELIRAVNIFPYPLHTAALQDKANTPFTSDFVILTTNLTNFRVESIKSQEAFQRRIHLNMRVTLRPEVAKKIDNQLRLDENLLREFQEEKGLPAHDLSHLIFIDEEGTRMDYNGFVVRVSKQYQKHKRAFEQRQTDNDLTAEMPLPDGSFSEDQRWNQVQPQHSGPEEEIEHEENLEAFGEFDEQEPFSYEDFVRVTRPSRSVQEQIARYNLRQRFGFSRLVMQPIQRFNGIIRRRFVEPILDRQASRFVLSLWSDLTDIRLWFRDRAAPIFRFFSWMSVSMGCTVLLFSFYSRVSNDEQELNMYHPFLATILNLVEASVDVSLASMMNNFFFFVTVAGVTIKISRLVLRDMIYHSMIHRIFDVDCDVCKKYKKIVTLVDPSAVEESSEQLLERLNEIEKSTQVEDESSMKTQQVKQKIQVESPTRTMVRKKEASVEHRGLYHLFPDFESGRASDEKKKTRVGVEMSQAEGVRCAQTEMIKGTIRRNTWILEAKFDDRSEHIGFVVVIKGLKALINNHYFEYMCVLRKNAKDKENFSVYFRQPNMEKGHPGSLSDLVKSAQPVFRGQHQTEFYMISLPPTCNFGRDLTKHLIETKKASSLVRGVPLQLVTYRPNGVGWEPTTVSGPLEKIHTVELPDVFNTTQNHIYMESAYYGIPTKKGDCGSCVLIDSNEFPKKILGFHFAGLPGKGIASVVTFSDVIDLVKNEPCVADPQHIILKEVPNFPLAEGSFSVQGEATVKISHPCKSSIETSLVHGLFGEPEMRPAILAPPLQEDGPMIRALRKNAGEVIGGIDKLLLSDVKRDYFQTCIAPYEPLGKEQEILNFYEACTGIEGNDYFPPIKRGKSAGYPYMATAKKGKTEWFGADEWDFSSVKCKDLRRDVHQLIEDAKHGIVPEAVFVATLKDEKRTNAKVDSCKTRVFSACPQHYLIAFRQYFAGFIAFMGRNKISNESAIGTNCHGFDWKEIVRHLTPWAPQSIVAGDFKEFDGTFQPVVFDSICDIINDFYQGTEEHNRIRRSLWRALVNPMHVLGPYIFSFSHGQPSGSPITAISNSIYVSLCFRYILRPILTKQKMSFKNHVRLIAYGDDSMISFSPHLAKHITPLLISDSFSKVLGMKYTSATKEQFTIDDGYQCIEEVSFLKRMFVFDKERSHWFAPLDLMSIRELCNWIRKSPSPEQATIDNCSNALQELCHHPLSVFNSYRDVILSSCKNHGLLIHVPEWESVRTQMSLGQIDYMSDERPFV